MMHLYRFSWGVLRRRRPRSRCQYDPRKRPICPREEGFNSWCFAIELRPDSALLPSDGRSVVPVPRPPIATDGVSSAASLKGPFSEMIAIKFGHTGGNGHLGEIGSALTPESVAAALGGWSPSCDVGSKRRQFHHRAFQIAHARNRSAQSDPDSAPVRRSSDAVELQRAQRLPAQHS
jgi:hypothetical protein